MVSATSAFPRNLISDRFAIRSAVTTIRNAFTRTEVREPLHAGPSERRAAARIVVQVPVTVMPAVVDEHGVWLQAWKTTPIRARSRDISLCGVGFTHATRLPRRHAVLSFILAAIEPICLVVEVAWSHRQPDGSYLSGSKILGLIDLDDAHDAPGTTHAIDARPCVWLANLGSHDTARDFIP